MKTGEIVIFERGEYSDYQFNGPFKVIKDFTMKEAVKSVRSEFDQTKNCGRGPEPYEIISFLKTNGMIEDFDVTTIHIGSYGVLDVSKTDLEL